MKKIRIGSYNLNRVNFIKHQISKLVATLNMYIDNVTGLEPSVITLLTVIDCLVDVGIYVKNEIAGTIEYHPKNSDGDLPLVSFEKIREYYTINHHGVQHHVSSDEIGTMLSYYDSEDGER